jgi:hypothetical protein
MEVINHGVILGQRPEDYQAGAYTFISYEERNKTGDWRQFLPVKEIQYGKEDSLSCVSFSACNAIEAQFKHQTGKEVNFSDRWLAKMSGTTTEGNWLYKVGDTVRKFGLVLEEDYPTPPNYTFKEYHKDIPEPLYTQLIEKGRAFLRKWDVKTEFVPATKADMIKHLKHAPLQIVVPGHAILNFLCEEDVVNYFDTYQPHEKKTPYANVQAAYKYVLTPRTMAKRFIINDGGKIGVAVIEGFTGTIVFAKTPEALEDLKAALEVPSDAPTFNYPQ